MSISRREFIKIAVTALGYTVLPNTAPIDEIIDSSDWIQSVVDQSNLSVVDKIYLKQLLTTLNDSLNDFVGEPNDEFTRNKITTVLETYLTGLNTLKTQKAIQSFEVRCDDVV